MRRLATLGILGALTLSATIASASVTQPNGIEGPVSSNNGEVQLATFFSSRGETFDAFADAHATPATFSPLCDFKVTLVLREASSSGALYWYNVTGAAPALSELHVLLQSGSAIGASAGATAIRSDPAYAGGLVGFVLMMMSDQLHFTESDHNPLCTTCNPQGRWITAVTYASKTGGFYIAFEDANMSASNFNSDNDYNDYVIHLEGVQCSGGGVHCDTGRPGVCATGVTACGQNVTCQQLNQASAETCNGLDDDCNGLVDDDPSMCGSGKVCDHGTCRAACTDTSCPAGAVCGSGGTCIEGDCAGVVCASGQTCSKGQCRAACDGVVCPSGQICQGDRCIDPCKDVTCGTNQVCHRGTCIARCDCRACDAGRACNTTSGLCIDPACSGVTCTAGSICSAGTCVNACDGVSCPPDQECKAGACTDVPAADAGADASVPDASSPTVDAGDVDAGEEDWQPPESDACGCSVPGRSAVGLGGVWAIACGALLAHRRRGRAGGSRG